MKFEEYLCDIIWLYKVFYKVELIFRCESWEIELIFIIN